MDFYVLATPEQPNTTPRPRPHPPSAETVSSVILPLLHSSTFTVFHIYHRNCTRSQGYEIGMPQMCYSLVYDICVFRSIAASDSLCACFLVCRASVPLHSAVPNTHTCATFVVAPRRADFMTLLLPLSPFVMTAELRQSWAEWEIF